MLILVTGGAGYIGSHTCLALLNNGHKVIVLDNLSNSHPESLKRVETLTNKSIAFIEGDVRSSEDLTRIFKIYKFDAVIHFAGLKAVGESVADPIRYYQNNLAGSINLFDEMNKAGVKKLVFSSSATVYGDPEYLPIDENHPTNPKNPYGKSKLFVEQMLADISNADPEWRIAILRYFNPVGAHKSGMIGESPLSIPNNLMPFITQVALGLREKLNIWGNDYLTSDGTGVRDYIHVEDLAEGHIKALEALSEFNILKINLGTGSGSSVLEILKTFEKVSNKNIPYEFKGRRAGDVAQSYADPSYAKRIIGWTATKNIDDMCRDTWNWSQKNPKGYS